MTDPWDDPPESARREFKHGPWKGMPIRSEWNSSPSIRPCKLCIECGYKWDQVDFTYAAHPSKGPEVHHICWNCWMIDNNPDEVRSYWDKVDNGGKVKAPTPKLDRL